MAPSAPPDGRAARVAAVHRVAVSCDALPQPRAWPAAVLVDEVNSCRFGRGDGRAFEDIGELQLGTNTYVRLSPSPGKFALSGVG